LNNGLTLITRTLSNGTIDSTYGNNDIQIFWSGSAAALQSDGKIVIVGSINLGISSAFTVSRFNTTGSLIAVLGDK